MISDSVLAHLITVVDSIETDLMLPLRAHERENRGGFLGISRQVFCYVDYLGALAANGTNSTKNAVSYLERYFVAANPDYSGKCNLIYGMWRHGTVHELDPKVLQSTDEGFVLRWGANNTSVAHNRKWHLKCLCRDGQPGTYHWFINLFQLVEDLHDSVAHFAADLERDAGALARAQRNLVKLSAMKDLDPTNALLLAEARAVVADAAGVIDGTGSVVREFLDARELDEYRQGEWRVEPLT